MIPDMGRIGLLAGVRNIPSFSGIFRFLYRYAASSLWTFTPTNGQ
jgi:hypothetical protein